MTLEPLANQTPYPIQALASSSVKLGQQYLPATVKRIIVDITSGTFGFPQDSTVVLVYCVTEHICWNSLWAVAWWYLCKMTEQEKTLVFWPDLQAGTVVILNRVGWLNRVRTKSPVPRELCLAALIFSIKMCVSTLVF